MTYVVPAVLGGLALMVMALVSMASRRRVAAANQPGEVRADVPRVLVHDINDDRCTGCDACVAVCPTNVLDLIDNKSRVVRFQDCIQCEACMWACPTQALVMHPEGTQPPALKVPELDEFYQTAVPGQYLIGEVAGKPLVKNAANLGRAVVEHMLKGGLKPGAGRSKMAEGSDAAKVTAVDVVIVGSGPGGLSAALTCIQRGLSYVVIEKDVTIASTIAHYPKGKLIMAEPYDTANLSLLPVFDSSKEQMLPIWRDLVERVGMNVRHGETVESVERRADGVFAIKTNVSSYRAQRVVLATGTRGKPRTLGVKGENLPKVNSLLDDPDLYRGKHVLVVGGGDSACEAAIALADAGAKVIVSYRGRSFNRAQPKNKQTIESYAASKRIKAKFQSQVEEINNEGVILAMADGVRKLYPNDATFVLIGADPPIAWLAKLGIQFVERPHQYKMSQSDQLIRRFLGDTAIECPETAADAAALVAGEVPSIAARPARTAAAAEKSEATGAKKWLRSATGLFTSSGRSKGRDRDGAPASREISGPMPLSEFAKRGRKHTGQGRRDQLEPGERTRVLRMLRDEGARLADEDSRVYLVESQDVNLESGSPAPAPMTLSLDEDSGPRPAVIVGLARAMAETPGRKKRPTVPPPVQQAAPPARAGIPASPPPAQPERGGRAAAAESKGQVRKKPPTPPPPPGSPRRSRQSSPPPFVAAPTQQIDTSALPALLAQSGARRSGPDRGLDDFQEPTRAVDFDAPLMTQQAANLESLRGAEDVIVSRAANGAIDIETGGFLRIEDQRDESTRAVDTEDLARMERALAAAGPRMLDAPTRAIPIDGARRQAGATSRPKPPTAPPPARTKPPTAPPKLPKPSKQAVAANGAPRSLTDVDWDLD